MNLYEYAEELEGNATTTNVKWLAVLSAQLPLSSRVAVASHPENAWDVQSYLLRQIEFQLRALIWGLAGGEKAGAKPTPILSPAENAAHESAVDDAARMAETVAAVFNLERG